MHDVTFDLTAIKDHRMPFKYYIGPLLLLVGAAIGLVALVCDRRKRRALMHGRTRLSMDQIYEEFFLTSGLSKNSIEKAWRIVADFLAVDFGLLRPADQLDHLRSGSGLSWDVDDLEMFIGFESRGRRRPTIATIDDAVRFIATLEQEKKVSDSK